MSYTKQTWSTGDTVTAAKLNHMEDGIAEAGGGSGGGVLVVTCTKKGSPIPTKVTADKTCKEIFDAYVAGTNIIFLGANALPDAFEVESASSINMIAYSEEDGYAIYVSTFNSELAFEGQADDYAVATINT